MQVILIFQQLNKHQQSSQNLFYFIFIPEFLGTDKHSNPFRSLLAFDLAWPCVTQEVKRRQQLILEHLAVHLLQTNDVCIVACRQWKDIQLTGNSITITSIWKQSVIILILKQGKPKSAIASYGLIALTSQFTCWYDNEKDHTQTIATLLWKKMA